jgi:hypothetical protein
VLDLIVTAGCYFTKTGETDGFVVFDGDMDTTSVPDKTKFTVTSDVGPLTINVMSWDGDNDLHFVTLENGIPTSQVCLEYSGGDPDFKTARGKLVKPFGPICMDPC